MKNNDIVNEIDDIKVTSRPTTWQEFVLFIYL